MSAGPFPSFAWAWPTGGRDQLLRAAILPDHQAALAVLEAWINEHPLDDATFTEQRLLVGIAARLPEGLPFPERPRLRGIERMLWTRSIVGLRAAAAGMATLNAAGLDVMVFKGAARAAINMADLRGRVAHDVDVLMRREQMDAAIAVLEADGWVAGGDGARDMQRAMGIDFRKGEHGAIDLHRFSCHQIGWRERADAGVWERSRPVEFLGTTVRVPSPEDRLVIAIAHGGIDGHSHSDWLVDCARLIAEGLDWPLVVDLLEERKLMAYAGIALSYLHDRCSVTIPDDAYRQIVRQARRNPLRLWGALVESKPKREHSAVSTVGRGVFRGLRVTRRALALRKATGRLPH